MHDLPRKLTADELAELFGGRTRFVERLAERGHPFEVAREVLAELPQEEQVEALNAHPRIGERSPEQRGSEPGVLADLVQLNQVYEEKFGFRFVVFVAGRSRAELVPVLRERLTRTRDAELETGLDELVEIARDRWQRR